MIKIVFFIYVFHSIQDFDFVMMKNRLTMVIDIEHVKMKISVDVLISVRTIQLQYLLYFHPILLMIEYDDEQKEISNKNKQKLRLVV